MMDFKPLHIHKNIVDRKRNIFFLFLPLAIFILLMALYFNFSNRWQLPRDASETVLGKQDNK
jgi:hypothetical protein